MIIGHGTGKREGWVLESVSFEEAEASTRSYWLEASPAERLNALEDLREQLYGDDPNQPVFQRVLELVPQA